MLHRVAPGHRNSESGLSSHLSPRYQFCQLLSHWAHLSVSLFHPYLSQPDPQANVWSPSFFVCYSVVLRAFNACFVLCPVLYSSTNRTSASWICALNTPQLFSPFYKIPEFQRPDVNVVDFCLPVVCWCCFVFFQARIGSRHMPEIFLWLCLSLCLNKPSLRAVLQLASVSHISYQTWHCYSFCDLEELFWRPYINMVSEYNKPADLLSILWPLSHALAYLPWTLRPHPHGRLFSFARARAHSFPQLQLIGQ